MTPPPDLPAFLDALRQHMTHQGVTQQDLGALVASIEGRAEPHGQGTVASWFHRTELARNPPRVFAIEQALHVPPGALSRLLGYLPIDAVPAATVAVAAAQDPDLTGEQREDLVLIWDTMRARTRRRRTGDAP